MKAPIRALRVMIEMNAEDSSRFSLLGQVVEWDFETPQFDSIRTYDRSGVKPNALHSICSVSGRLP